MPEVLSRKGQTLIAIPARLKATRLPDKPLADICGEPMIVHVWRRAMAADLGRVVVATDSVAIADAVRTAGGEAVMTRDDHPSGSDRIHEVVAALDPDGALDVVINLQGDLPTLDPGLIRAVAGVLADGPADIATLAAEITDEDERHNPNVVKVIGSPITDRLMLALYFTRSTAPHGDGPLYHHIGIYAYRRAALSRFVALPPSPLERRERLEQLRALEAGMRIDVAIVDTVPLGVDTPADLARARTVIACDRTGILGAPMRTPLATASLTEPLAPGAAQRVVYQGEPGANSHLACQHHFPDLEPVATETFEDCFAAVKSGAARYAMIPIENSVAGRVADIHHLLPESGLYITAEHFERVRHQLLGLPGATLADLKTVHSHTMALGQCRKVIRALGLRAVPEADTAGSARMIREDGDKSQAAIASRLAAEVHGLEILKADIEDAAHNTTRFIILSSEPDDAEPEDGPVITTFVFKVRNVPAALYKALGGFATNGVNMTKLESYQLEGTFEATMFYADIQGHPLDRSVRLALEELSFFSSEVRIFGTYRASPQRAILNASAPAMASHGK